MDWQSNRGSRKNRIRKEPEGNPFMLVVVIIVLVIAAVGLGYLISQTILPAFITVSSMQPPSVSVPSVVSSLPSSPESAASIESIPASEESTEVPSDPVDPEESTEVEDPESEGTTNPDDSTDIEDPTPDDGDDTYEAGYVPNLPTLSYYRVQVISAGTLEQANEVMSQLHAEAYVAAVIAKDSSYSVQVGVFNERSGAEDLTEAMEKAGYEGAWITTWNIVSPDASEQLSSEVRIRQAQGTAVSAFAETIELILAGEEPSWPNGLGLSEFANADEEALWASATDSLWAWVNDSNARRPGLMQTLLDDAQALYAWFE